MDPEKVEDAEIPSGQEDVERQPEVTEKEPPKDVRGAIKAALDEVREPREKEPKETRTERKPEERVPNKTQRQESKSRNEPGDEKTQTSEKLDKKVESKLEAVGYWKNKGKTTWDKLSDEDRQSILNREKEVSDGFAQVSQRVKNVENIERAIAPRLQSIQQYGVEPAVVVDRLFQWMEGLNNPQTRLNTFKALAQSFGVNVNQLTASPQGGQGALESEADNEGPPEWFNQFSNTVNQKVTTLESMLDAQRKSSVDAFVSQWSQGKTHYAKVAPLMGQLLAGGAIPPKQDGSVDLDAAYEAAVKLHPEISAQLQQEAAEKAQKEAADKAAKEAKERAEKLAKARKAAVGLKPLGSSPGVQPTKLNGAKKQVSVRESISQALDELRE
jgi:hypothetical protein